MPPLLLQVIGARVARLGGEARRLLAVAAAIGQEVPLGLWATVAGTDEEGLLDTIERAVEARLLTETPDGAGVRFAHALVREALYEGVLALRRRALHRRAAEALIPAPEADPDAVANHLRRADDPRAAEWLVRAGERAQRAFAWLTAAERYEAAVALLERRRGDASERAWLQFRILRLRRYGDRPQLLAATDGALRQAREAGDAALTAHLHLFRGYLRCFMQDIRDGLAEMTAGADALDALPPADHARLDRLEREFGLALNARAQRGLLVLFLACLGHHAAARVMGEPLLAGIAARRPDPGLDDSPDADTLRGLAIAYAALGLPDESARAYRRAQDLFEAIDHPYMIGQNVNFDLTYRVIPYRADRLVEREALAAAGERAWERSGGARPDVPPRLVCLSLLVVEGRWAEARAIALRARPIGGNTTISAFEALGPLAHAQGDTELAWSVVRERLPDGPATDPLPLRDDLRFHRLGGTLALDADDLAAARAWLEAHDRWLARTGAVSGRSEGEALWAVYHRAAGDPSLAREHAGRALAHAAAPRQPLALLAAHRLLGEMDTAASHRADARAHLDAALALADACAAPYERALTLLALAELHAAERRSDAARDTLAEARALIEPLGARPALARAAALAARLEDEPAHARRAPASLPFGLTARELDVLRLVAAGRTDREVAATLSLSARTASNHVARILDKVGAENRTALAVLALRHGLA